MKNAGLSLLVLLIVAASSGDLVSAGESGGSISPWTPDDLVKQERVSSFSLARDGSRAVWIKSVADKKKDGRVSSLMITDLEPGKSRQLTFGKDGVSSPEFAPDGSRISFLSRRPLPEGAGNPSKEQSGAQIWLLDLRGGEPQPITRVPFGVSSYSWADDRTIYFTARDRLSRREAKEKEDKDKSIVVEEIRRHQESARRLFRLSVDDKRIIRITENDDQIQRFFLSPDGRYVVTSHSLHPSHQAEGIAPPKWWLLDLGSRRRAEIFPERKNKPTGIHWDLDSTGFYVLQPHSSVDGEDYAAIIRPFRVDLSGLDDGALPEDLSSRIFDVHLYWDKGLYRGTFFVTEDGFVAGLCNGVQPLVARFTRDGNHYRSQFLRGEHSQAIFQMIRAKDSDAILYVTGDASTPDTHYSALLSGAEIVGAREFYRPNGGFSNKPIAKTEILRWSGAKGEPVEGILYYPHGYREGERYPLIAITHGGPHGADRNRFREDWANSANSYAQRGAAILKTNYHGSSDYGLEFGESIKGKYYELEVLDIFSGIQHLVDRGIADSDRLGLIGWSNGAILSIAAVTLDHLYAPGYNFKIRACAPGAGDVNWTSDYGNCAFGATFDDFYLGGAPWEIPELYLKKSPLFYVDRVETPTLIFFGTEDRAVPTSQGWEWYRALHRVGKAPVRFLLFPGEPHGLRKLTHQRRKLVEEHAWFDRYLFEKAGDEGNPIKRGSPLDVALARRDFARTDGVFGRLVQSTFVPETVEVDDLEVTRFEVTVAQWQAFDSSFTRGVPRLLQSRQNHPATGMSPSDVLDYVAWLRKKTGLSWRLPTVEEMKKLKKSAGTSENTLDYWAGYQPSQADEKRLVERLTDLGADRVLLAVGSRPPGFHGEGEKRVLLYDLGGNAAEFASDEEGKVIPHGSCAVRSPDPRRSPSSPPAEFVGFRLVVGEVASPEKGKS